MSLSKFAASSFGTLSHTVKWSDFKEGVYFKTHSWGHENYEVIQCHKWLWSPYLDFLCIQNLNADAASLMEPSCNGPLEMEKFQTYRNRLMAGAKRLGPNVNVALLLGLLASSLLVRWFSCLRKWKKGLGGLAKGQKKAAPSSRWLFFWIFCPKNI